MLPGKEREASKNEVFQVWWFTAWLRPTYCTLDENETYIQCLWKLHMQEHLVRQNSGLQWCASAKNPKSTLWFTSNNRAWSWSSQTNRRLVNEYNCPSLFSISKRVPSQIFSTGILGGDQNAEAKAGDFDASSRGQPHERIACLGIILGITHPGLVFPNHMRNTSPGDNDAPVGAKLETTASTKSQHKILFFSFSSFSHCCAYNSLEPCDRVDLVPSAFVKFKPFGDHAPAFH